MQKIRKKYKTVKYGQPEHQVERQIKVRNIIIDSSRSEWKVKGTKQRTSRFLVPLLYRYTPPGKTSEAEWQKDRCLLHTTEMFYQPLRSCQSMAGMFQNIFNTQREHFGLRKWIVPKIGRGLAGRVNHQRPFVLPLSQALRTKTFSIVSCVFVCNINSGFFVCVFIPERSFCWKCAGRKGICNSHLWAAGLRESTNLLVSWCAADECWMKGARSGKAVRRVTFETAISHNARLKSERAADPFSGIASKRLLSVFWKPPGHFMSSLPVWPLQVPRYLAANTGIREPCTSAALWKRKPLCRFILESTFQRPLCSSPRWRRLQLEELGFVTKATCWAGQPVVRQERSLWRTQVLGCPLACLSVSVALLAGHLYNCNFTQAKTKGVCVGGVQEGWYRRVFVYVFFVKNE